MPLKRIKPGKHTQQDTTHICVHTRIMMRAVQITLFLLLLLQGVKSQDTGELYDIFHIIYVCVYRSMFCFNRYKKCILLVMSYHKPVTLLVRVIFSLFYEKCSNTFAVDSDKNDYQKQNRSFSQRCHKIRNEPKECDMQKNSDEVF